MTKRNLKRLGATAHHEAGHAVARLWLGLGFRKASIIPDADEGTLGRVLHSGHPRWLDPETDNDNPRVKDRTEKEIISLFAGQIAEAKFRGHKPRYGMESDDERAVFLAMYMASGETLEAYLHCSFLRARDLVNARWREIRFVAEALMNGQALTKMDVINVIDKGLNLPPFPAVKQRNRTTAGEQPSSSDGTVRHDARRKPRVTSE